MMIVAREPLTKSEVEISIANVATLLVSASRMISGEVVPNFEAIVEQNEMSFAQKRKDLSTVRALLSGEDAAVPMLQKAAETIRNLHALSEAIYADAIHAVQIPAKPLPEDSLLRDTLRRLQYVQRVIESTAKWINEVGEHEDLKGSVLFTKIQQELIRLFKRVVIQLQQAAVIIGKYRDMGDIRVLREMTLDAQAVLSELKEADESVSEKRKSISFFKRAVEESKAAPKIVRQLASVTAGLLIVLMLSFAIIKLNALAPQVFPTSEPIFESIDKSPVEPEKHEIQTPGQRTHAKQGRMTVIKSETEVKPKEIALPLKNEISSANAETRREEIAPASTKLPPPPSTQPKPEVKNPEAKKPEASVVQAKESAPALKKVTNKPTERTAEKTTERKSASTKVWKEKEVTSQKNSERALPKRKRIVIED